MIKKIGIVSLSRGLLGEPFVQHEVRIGQKRLVEYGIEVVYLPHSLKGIQFLEEHPQKRAEDLLVAFQDESIDMILCAIGGDDTYRLLPYLFDEGRLKTVVNQKIFLGFSDTTINHFMLHKLGIKTFYGQAFLPDICELATDMLPYTKGYFEELIATGQIKEIRPSSVWYKEREDFTEQAIGTARESYTNGGFEQLSGPSVFEGEILGGCLESIYDIVDDTTNKERVSLCKHYQLLPSLQEWRGKILLLETSEEQPEPRMFRKMIQTIKELGVFDVVSGILFGKPQNERYLEEYKAILLEDIAHEQLPIVCNINVGHATPRCIVPFGVPARVDVSQQKIEFFYDGSSSTDFKNEG